MRLPAALPAPAFRTRPQDTDTHTHTGARCTDNGVVGRWATVGWQLTSAFRSRRLFWPSAPGCWPGRLSQLSRLSRLSLRPNSASCVFNNKSYAKAETAAQRLKVCSTSVMAIAHCVSVSPRPASASASQQPLMSSSAPASRTLQEQPPPARSFRGAWLGASPKGPLLANSSGSFKLLVYLGSFGGE